MRTGGSRSRVIARLEGNVNGLYELCNRQDRPSIRQRRFRLWAISLQSSQRRGSTPATINDRYAPSAGITYWFGPKWGTTIDAIYTRATFDNSDDYHDIGGIFQLNAKIHQAISTIRSVMVMPIAIMMEILGAMRVTTRCHAPSAGFIYDVAKDSRISLGARLLLSGL